MTLLKRWWSRTLATLRPQKHDDEFRAEIEAHLQAMVDERMARGMPEAAARRDAQLKLGGVAQLEELHREWRTARWLDATLRDSRHALRSLRRDPRFLAVAVGVVALGVGAGTAVFSVVRQSFFRPLPYDRSDRLVSFGITLPWFDQELLFGRHFAELSKSLPPMLSAVTSHSGVDACEVTLTSVRKTLPCAKVEASFLGVLGVRPALGRDFTASDDQMGAPPVMLLSHGFWRRTFGADDKVAGRTVVVDHLPTRIIGVLPQDFELPGGESADFLVPQKVDLQQQSQASPGRPLRVLARLSEGATLTGAQVAIRALFSTANVPGHVADSLAVRVRSVRDLRFRDMKLGFGFLAGSAACVFLTTCANVGFLLLVRASARRKERQLRMSLGADSLALFRQDLAEALMIAIPGVLLGVVLAAILLRLAVPFVPVSLLEAGRVNLDRPALLFAALCALVASVIFGSIPILGDRRSYSLNANRAAGNTVHGSRLRQMLVVSQIALCIALLGAATTLLRSLWQLRTESASYSRERVTTASFILGGGRYYSAEAKIAFFRELETALQATGLFTAVGIADSLPPSGVTRSQPLIALTPTQDQAGAASNPGGLVLWRFVTPGYFDALGIRVVRGRAFTAEDVKGRSVTVVNESLAGRLFPDGNFRGRTIVAGGVVAEVIGVVQDIRNSPRDRNPLPEYYALRRASAGGVYENQQPPYGWRRASVVVRSPLPDSAIRSRITEELKRLAPDMETTVETMAERFEAIQAQPRFQAGALMSFGLTGLLLAAAGVYGLVSFLVAERAQEFAVRLAIGATARQVRRLVLGLAFRWTVWGAATGTLLALAAGRLLQSSSHQIVRVDPVACLLASAVLGAVCVLTAWIPAMRAGLADPAPILREQ